MKKRNLIRKIHRYLRHWEGSQLDERCAREILELVEANGMTPPYHFVKRKKGEMKTISFDWESEK